MRFQQITAQLMNRVRVNSVRPEIRGDVQVFIKTRRLGGSFVIWCGNRFLSLADSGVHMFVRTREWIAWELHCVQLLYPNRTATSVRAGRVLVMPEVRGISLREIVRSNKLNTNLAEAAAREIRRAHQIHCPVYNGGWSHGDLHLDNIFYDHELHQATLIDFDTRHEPELHETTRHADDLKTVLLELISISATGWNDIAFSFLNAYQNFEVLRELSLQLTVPHGIARIFWHTRTANCSLQKIEPQLQSLREIIHQIVDNSRTTPQFDMQHGAGRESQL